MSRHAELLTPTQKRFYSLTDIKEIMVEVQKYDAQEVSSLNQNHLIEYYTEGGIRISFRYFQMTWPKFASDVKLRRGWDKENTKELCKHIQNDLDTFSLEVAK